MLSAHSAFTRPGPAPVTFSIPPGIFAGRRVKVTSFPGDCAFRMCREHSFLPVNENTEDDGELSALTDLLPLPCDTHRPKLPAHKKRKAFDDAGPPTPKRPALGEGSKCAGPCYRGTPCPECGFNTSCECTYCGTESMEFEGCCCDCAVCDYDATAPYGPGNSCYCDEEKCVLPRGSLKAVDTERRIEEAKQTGRWDEMSDHEKHLAFECPRGDCGECLCDNGYEPSIEYRPTSPAYSPSIQCH